MIGHSLHHALVAVGLYRAGAAFTRPAQRAWLAVAALACWACHRHHHQNAP